MYFTSGSDRPLNSSCRASPVSTTTTARGGHAGGLRHLPLLSPALEISILRLCGMSLPAGKLTAYDAVTFRVKGVENMAVFRVERNKGYR